MMSDPVAADEAYMPTILSGSGQYMILLSYSLVEYERGGDCHTGTVTTVSAMKSFFSQCNTKLPEKCPPVLIAVMPGSIC